MPTLKHSFYYCNYANNTNTKIKHVKSLQSVLNFLKMSLETTKARAWLIVLHLQNLRTTFWQYFFFSDKSKDIICKIRGPLEKHGRKRFHCLAMKTLSCIKKKITGTIWEQDFTDLISYLTSYLSKQYFSSIRYVKSKERKNS